MLYLEYLNYSILIDSKNLKTEVNNRMNNFELNCFNQVGQLIKPLDNPTNIQIKNETKLPI